MVNQALLKISGDPTARVAALVAWQEVLLPYFRDPYRARLLAQPVHEPDQAMAETIARLTGGAQPQPDVDAFLKTDVGIDTILTPSIRGLVGAWTNLCTWVAETQADRGRTLAFDAALMPQYEPFAPGDPRAWDKSIDRVFHGLLTVDDVKTVFERVKSELAPDQPLPPEALAALASYGVAARAAS